MARIPRPSGLLALALLQCGGPAPTGICANPPSPEAVVMCTCDAAVAQALEGHGRAGGRLCDTLGDALWREECHFRVAEGLAMSTGLSEAFDACEQAGAFGRMCVGHAAWMRSEVLVEVGPSDADAQAAIDTLANGVPARPAGLEPMEMVSIARGAAWHGVYAGSGNTDPTAARGASVADAAAARGAFAWEAVRLLGPSPDIYALWREVVALWRGERAPVVGAPLPQACWEVRLVPRANVRTDYGVPDIRTYSGEIRFVSDDPETDLLVATAEASWGLGVDIDPMTLRLMARNADIAVRSTAARHMGVLPELFPDLESALPDDETAPLAVARDARSAFERGSSPRAVVRPTGVRCKP